MAHCLTRSRRTEKLEAQRLIRAGRANITGLSAIPTEILLNIVSNFKSIPIPYGGHDNDGTPVEFLERSRALDALSQTCRRLRSVLFPVMWQKIEVGVEKQGYRDHAIGKRLATELLRQLEVVTVRDPTLALHVREVNVFISGYSQKTILPEFVRALCMFPNMTTLQIIELAGNHNGEEIAKAFHGGLFPSVKLLVLPGGAITSIECFPKVRCVYSTNELALLGVHYWRELANLCPESVVTIGGFTIWARQIFTMVATYLYHLRDIQISGPALISGELGDLESILRLLRQMRNLEVLRIWNAWRHLDAHTPTLLSYARRMLTTMRAHQRDGDMKKVVIITAGQYDLGGPSGSIEIVIDKDDDDNPIAVV